VSRPLAWSGQCQPAGLSNCGKPIFRMEIGAGYSGDYKGKPKRLSLISLGLNPTQL